MFLPQAHSFARAINYIVVASNVHIYIAAGIKTLISDLQVARPSIMIVVPRVLEKVYNAASQKAGHGPKGVVFASAVVAAQNYMKEVSTNGKAGALTRTRRAAFDPIVYSCCAKCSAVAPSGLWPAVPRLTRNCWPSSVARVCLYTRAMV